MQKLILATASNRKLWKIAFFVVLATLLYLTLTPSPPKPIEVNQIDKVYHFLAFFGFTAIFAIAYRRLSIGQILVISILVGIGIEAAQYYVPNRWLSLGDVVADILGCVAGAGMGRILRAGARSEERGARKEK